VTADDCGETIVVKGHDSADGSPSLHDEGQQMVGFRRVPVPRMTLLLCMLGVTISSSPAVHSEDSHPLEPADALKTFELEDGLVIELVASEPQVVDPVAISFDHLGRMYVAEYRDYPLGPDEGQPPLSQIKLLEDRDNDGVFETATLFAGVPWAQGVLAHGRGVIVTASPRVLYLEDTDGDGKADHQEVLLDGFGFGNPQLRVGHPRRGLDQRIYLTNGLTGGNVTVGAAESATGKPLTMGRNDLVYDPRSRTIDLVPGQAQFGNTFDDFGNRFFCTNRNPIIYAPLSHATLTRNPFAPALTPQEDVAPSGGASRVYSLIEGKTTAVSHAGTHTAACGTHVTRGSLYPSADSNERNVFVCEPTGSLVTRTILRPHGTSFSAHRPYERRDFLTSRDPWFRPASLADGPDGHLYLADMYREVIEHPQYMPDGLAATLRLRAGDDRGRIYRIRRRDQPVTHWVPQDSTASQLAALQSPVGWRRDLAQRLLLEQTTSETAVRVAGELEALFAHAQPNVVSQALWTLAGLQRQGLIPREQLQKSVTSLCTHSSPLVLEQVILVTQAHQLDPLPLKSLFQSVDSMEPRVALRWIDAMAPLNDIEVRQELGSLIAHDSKDYWIRQIALTLPPETAAVLLSQLLKSDEFLETGDESRQELMNYLAVIVGKRAVSAELQSVLESVLSRTVSGLPWWKSSTLFGLDQGLSGGKGLQGKTSLAAITELSDSPLKPHAEQALTSLEAGIQTVVDNQAASLDRRAAIPSLGKVSLDEALPVLLTLMTSNADPHLRRAAYLLVNSRTPEKTLQTMLDAWPDLGPASRALVIESALARPVTALALVQAMSDGIVSPSLLTIEQKEPLTWVRDPKMVALVKKVFGDGASKDRAAVIENYRKAILTTGDAGKGREVFRRVCSQCHKVGDEGTLVGPDLSDIRAKGKDVLLSDILDPSRAIEPRWTSYVAATADGRIITGLLVRENATEIVLRMAKGVEESLPRDEIDALRANEQSLMPAGIEADVTVEQMADLLEFLKSGR